MYSSMSLRQALTRGIVYMGGTRGALEPTACRTYLLESELKRET